MASTHKYLQKIDGQSFSNCVDFMVRQAELLGVTLSPSAGLGEIIYQWAAHLAQDSNTNKELVYKCIDMMKAVEVDAAYRKASDLHNRLMNKVSLMEKLFGSADNELVKTIVSHPFYTTLQQQEPLANGFSVVQRTYQEYQKIKKDVNSIAGKLNQAKSILSNLQEQNYTLADIHIPASMTSSLDTIASIDVTIRLLKENPKLYYSPTALGNLANAAALGSALDYKKAILAVDLNLARWQSIGYFSIMMNALARNEIGMEVLMAGASAQNAQYKEFAQLMSNVVHR